MTNKIFIREDQSSKSPMFYCGYGTGVSGGIHAYGSSILEAINRFYDQVNKNRGPEPHDPRVLPEKLPFTAI